MADFCQLFVRPRVASRYLWRVSGCAVGEYLTAILQRDVRDLTSIADLAALPRLLAVLASRSVAVLNAADLSRVVGLPQTTLKRYLALLEATFLVRMQPPWFVNIGKRLVKSPKVCVADTGLASHLLGLDAVRLAGDRTLLGGLLENLIVMEVVKQSGWSTLNPSLFHFRSHDGREVDLVLEAPDGRVVGVEVKAAVTVGAADFKGLRWLAEASGPRFHRGLLLYSGAEVVPFGSRLFAVPHDAVWDWEGVGEGEAALREGPATDYRPARRPAPKPRVRSSHSQWHFSTTSRRYVKPCGAASRWPPVAGGSG